MNQEAQLFKMQLMNLGVAKGDVVLVHSSMKALKTQRTPREIIMDIQEVIGMEGTLLVPALTYDHVTSKQTVFSVKETEPCIGAIPRSFLHMDGVIRSLHPTHSVCAWGKLAKWITKEHILDETPVGIHSPFMKLAQLEGKILFIGNILEACTFMHGVEEIVGTTYTLKKERTHYIIEDYEGNKIERNLFEHDFWGWGAEYQRIENILSHPDIKCGKVGEADCYLIDAKALLNKATEKLQEEPYYFVTDIREYM